MKKGFLFLAVLSTLSSYTAAGYDQQISADTSLEGYSVYSGNGTVLSRRRVVGNIDLGAWNILPGETDPYYKGPRLSADLSIRIMGDMGISKRETQPTSELGYVPGAEPVSFSFLTGYIDAHGFWKDTLDIRAGRQIRLDTLGFFAFDGIDTRLRLPAGITVVAYLGMEVRGGQSLGYDNFELDGTNRGDRSDLESDRYPDLEEPKPRMAGGCEVILAPWRWLEAAASFRAVGIVHDAGNLADQRVGGRLDVHAGIFHADARTVYNAMVNTISEADGEVGVTPWDRVGISAEYHRYRPSFEGDSIFNVFDISPQNDVGGRIDARVNRLVKISGWGFARINEEGTGPNDDDGHNRVSGAGGGIGTDYRTPARSLSARFSMAEEWGERRIGAELGGGHGFLRKNRLWLSFRLSYWHIEDDFSELYRGDVAGYVLSGRFNITHRLRFLGEFEHYVGDGRPSRLTGYALLSMDLWR